MDDAEHTVNDSHKISYRRLFSFFIPLGLSAILVTVSHVIIQSTLARSPMPEVTIASFAVAMSVFIITEKPAVLLRQTCSALVRDRVSFLSMSKLTLWLILCVLVFGFLISYTPAGTYMFMYIFSIGMVIRLLAMYLLSLFFIHSGWTIDGRTGAIFFMCGML